MRNWKTFGMMTLALAGFAASDAQADGWLSPTYPAGYGQYLPTSNFAYRVYSPMPSSGYGQPAANFYGGIPVFGVSGSNPWICGPSSGGGFSPPAVSSPWVQLGLSPVLPWNGGTVLPPTTYPSAVPTSPFPPSPFASPSNSPFHTGTAGQGIARFLQHESVSIVISMG